MMKFQRQDCRSTLEAGLAEFYASNRNLDDGRYLPDSARDFFRCHDVAHVVFGCSTSLTNEVMVKIWSFFGTTAGLSLLREYRSPASRGIYERIMWTDIPRTAFRSALTVPVVLVRCRKMHKRWPWSDFDPYANVALAEIREEHGIEVLAVP